MKHGLMQLMWFFYFIILQRLFFAKCDQGLGIDENIQLSFVETDPKLAIIIEAKVHN